MLTFGLYAIEKINQKIIFNLLIRSEEAIYSALQANRLLYQKELYQKNIDNEWWLFGKREREREREIVDIECMYMLKCKHTTIIEKNNYKYIF